MPRLFTFFLITAAVLATISWLPGQFDVASLLRSQADPAQQRGRPAPQQQTRRFRWTPAQDTAPGEKTLTLVATDEQGNSTTRNVKIEVLPRGEGAVHSVAVTPRDTSADVAWQASEEATGKVEIDLTADLRNTFPTNSAEKRAAHRVALNNLRPCTSYYFRITAEGGRGGRQIVDNTRTFTTTGCAGNAAVNNVASITMPRHDGGSLTLGEEISLTAPTSFATKDTHFQIHQLNREQALGAISKPEGKEPISGLYQIGALTNPYDAAASFEQPLALTLTYVPSETTKLETIDAYRWDGNSWSAVGCTNNQDARKLSCNLQQFSAFGVFGTGGSTDAPSNNGNGGAPVNEGGGDGGGGGSGGGGGGDSGENNSSAPDKLVRSFIYQAERDHKIAGNLSSIEPTQTTVVLAGSAAGLEKKVSVPRDTYYLDIKARHDASGPVRLAVYVNNKAWKTITWKKDNQYRIQRVGSLRNFSGGAIRIRVVAEGNQKFYLDWWRLTTDSNIATASAKTTTADTAKAKTARTGGRSAGWLLIPNLNIYIAQELGSRYVTVDIWEYYARRLTLLTNDPEVIQSEKQLRDTLRYWKSQRPARPRGD